MNSGSFSRDTGAAFFADEVVILGVQAVVAVATSNSELEDLDFITDRALSRWRNEFFAGSTVLCFTINFNLKIRVPMMLE